MNHLPPAIANIVIAYKDGSTETIEGVRIQEHRDDNDPVVYKNGILSVENGHGDTFYRVEVRGWTFEHPMPAPWDHYEWQNGEPPF